MSRHHRIRFDSFGSQPKKTKKGFLTYSNVVSSLALFLVLSGGIAYGASQIGTGDIKPGAVKTKTIARNAVTAAKIAPGAINGGMIAPGAIGASQLAPGARSAG